MVLTDRKLVIDALTKEKRTESGKETFLVKGDLVLDSDTVYYGNLHVYGRIVDKEKHSLKVIGDVFSRGIEIGGDIEVTGNLHTLDISAHNVTANAMYVLNVKAHVMNSNSDILVSGNANVNGIFSKGKIEILGSLTALHAQGSPLIYDQKLFAQKKSKVAC
jgi:hypothetical protein